MLSFADATGNLLNRLGKLGALVAQARSFMSSQEDNMIDEADGVVGQYNAEPDIQALVGSVYIGLLNGSAAPFGALAQNVASQTINRMVFRDNPRISQNLQTLNTLASIQEVIRQMNVEGATVLQQTTTATPGAFTGFGNGIVVTSIKRPSDGRMLENAYAEDLQLVCSNDSLQGTAEAGSESFTVTGTGGTGFFDFDWPLGSNGQNTYSAINGDADASGGNILTNSGFTNFTSNAPDNFELVVGTAGVAYFQETTLVYDNSLSALRILGDGSSLYEFKQEFNSADGTNDTLDDLTQYAFNMWMRRDGIASVSGTMEVSLVDENDEVVQDSAGDDNLFTVNLTLLDVNYASYTGVFRTPLILPDQLFIRWRLLTPYDNGRSFYMDRMGLGLMQQLYVHGPFLAIFSGGTEFIQGDYAYVAVTNSRGAGGTLNTWQTVCLWMFPDFASLEILLPSSPTPSISDNLLSA